MTFLGLKILVVVLAIILLLVLLAWAQAECVIAWARKEFQKSPRLPNRWPKTSLLRKLLFQFFNIKASRP